MYQPPLFCAAAGSAKAAAATPSAVTTEAILMLFPFPFYCWNKRGPNTNKGAPGRDHAGRNPRPPGPPVVAELQRKMGGGGASRSRTGLEGFAGLCITA